MSTDRETHMEEETKRKKRGEEEEKGDTGSRNFRDCYLLHHKSQRNGHGRDPSHKSQKLRILCCKWGIRSLMSQWIFRRVFVVCLLA